MKVKQLLAILAIMTGFYLAGFSIQSIAVGHGLNSQWGSWFVGFDRSLIVLNYLTLFAGVAISVLGCVVFCLKGRGVGSVIALLVMAGLALILCFLSMIVGYETVMREGNYALVVVGLALPP